MNRKTIKTRTGAYHVTLPIRLVEEFDETLGFKDSRSRKIAEVMKQYLNRDMIHEVWKMPPIDLCEHLQYRFKKDSPEDVLIQSLMVIIQKHDEQSS